MLSLNFFNFSPSPGLQNTKRCSHTDFFFKPHCTGLGSKEKHGRKRNSPSPARSAVDYAILSWNFFNFSLFAGLRNTKRCSCIIIKKLLSIDFLTQYGVDLHCHWSFAVAELCPTRLYPSATHNQISTMMVITFVLDYMMSSLRMNPISKKEYRVL